ncbi:helix-turn-helix domain-containing protein [Microlunatus sp. Y2014]|uniref:helix-turn-helix domain-containing protein n=1 Tax=Microlunatus sp. Y2014 TaxID=3418488 RepID=UPI003DA7872D
MAPRRQAVTVTSLYLSTERHAFVHASDSYRRWVMITVMSGAFRFQLDLDRPREGTQAAGECRPGSLVLCPPGTRFERALLGTSRFLFAEFELTTGRPWWPVGKVVAGDPQRLRADLQLLDRRYGVQGVPTGLLHDLVVTDLLVLAAPRPVATPHDPLISRVTDVLTDRARDPELAMAGVAGDVGLSPSQFTRRFVAVHGVTPLRYVTERRIDHARTLLIDTDRTVTQIAAACGYRSVHYFSRAFKREVGQSPQLYRSAGRI